MLEVLCFACMCYIIVCCVKADIEDLKEKTPYWKVLKFLIDITTFGICVIYLINAIIALF